MCLTRSCTFQDGFKYYLQKFDEIIGRFMSEIDVGPRPFVASSRRSDVQGRLAARAQATSPAAHAKAIGAAAAARPLPKAAPEQKRIKETLKESDDKFKDVKEAKENKEHKESKENKEHKETKELHKEIAKELVKEHKDAKEAKEHKEQKDQEKLKDEGK